MGLASSLWAAITIGGPGLLTPCFIKCAPFQPACSRFLLLTYQSQHRLARGPTSSFYGSPNTHCLHLGAKQNPVLGFFGALLWKWQDCLIRILPVMSSAWSWFDPGEGVWFGVMHLSKRKGQQWPMAPSWLNWIQHHARLWTHKGKRADWLESMSPIRFAFLLFHFCTLFFFLENRY